VKLENYLLGKVFDLYMMTKEINNSWKRRAGRNLLLAGGTLGLLAYGTWHVGCSRFNPKTKGTLRLEGLQAGVEVIRDRWGVPHLYASNLEDLFFAQGFVQAQDRFWQMELQRRIAAGRLAEILGEPALEADRFLRRFELYREAEKSYKWAVQHDDITLLERFTAGVNAFIALNKLPLEFSLLRYKPEPWLAVDSIAWSNVVAFGQSNNFVTELARAEILRSVGPEMAARLDLSYKAGESLTIPPDANYSGVDFGRLLEEYGKLADLLGFARAGGGSNSWVVDGAKSVTGQPLFANDPHLAMQMPGVFYAMHLHAPDFEVIGATIPGVPGVMLGHNRHIAWGITTTMVDYQDAFIESSDPQNPRRYQYKGEWLEFESHFEEIKVKSRVTPVRQEQFRSVHGPIVSEFALVDTVATNGRKVQDAPVALCWSLYQRPLYVNATLDLNRARNWDEFRAALKNWSYPSLNFTYADVAGNIGYQFTGHIPIRAKGLGLLPNPGHTGEYDWTAFIPFEELPSLYNPATHYLFSANNKVVGDDYPYYLPGEYSNGARAERIRRLLTTKERLAPDDYLEMFRDVLSLDGLRLLPHLVSLSVSDSLERRALTILAMWDGRLEAESVGACLYQVVLSKLLRLVLEPQLGTKATNHYLGISEGGLSAVTTLSSKAGPHLLSFLERNDTSLLPPGLTWEAALRRALSAAVDWLRGKLGDDPGAWQWGKLHQMPFNHVLGAKRPLDKVFNRASLPIGGDADTIFQTAFAFKKDEFAANAGTPGWRMLADLSNWENSLMSVTSGQSGSPFSPHYADLIEPWLNAELHPMLFSRATLAAHTTATLKLEPTT
jgi:penicillin G amidase